MVLDVGSISLNVNLAKCRERKNEGTRAKRLQPFRRADAVMTLLFGLAAQRFAANGVNSVM